MPLESVRAGDPAADLQGILDDLTAAVRQVNDAYERICNQVTRQLAMAAAVRELEEAVSQLRPPSDPITLPLRPRAVASDTDEERPFARMLNPPSPPPDLEQARERLGNIRWRLRDLGRRRGGKS